MPARGNLAAAGFVMLVGGFVAAAGAGSTNVLVAAMGAGLTVSGMGYAAFTVTRRRRARLVTGTGQVVAATRPPAGATHGRCDMHLVIQAPGMRPTTVRHRDTSVPVAAWPTRGHLVPVLVDPQDPRNLRVLWKRARPLDPAPTRRSIPSVEYLSEAPPSAPDDAELAQLADAATRIAGSATATAVGHQPAPPPPQRRNPAPAPGPSRHPEPPSRPSGSAQGRSAPAPEDTPPLSDDDPLLAAYGSPIREVGVTVVVSDLERSLRFYRDVLGFFEIESGPGMVLLEARAGRLVLRQRDGAQTTTATPNHLSLEVSDIESAHRTLSRRGVSFLDEPRRVLRGELLEMWAASFPDPDGHLVAVTCWRPRSD